MSSDSFRRYTNLPVLLDILSSKKLTLLDPVRWDDKNDSYFIELYKKRSGLSSVLAICFAEAPETYHHWKVYSSDSSGVCIVFDKEELLKYFKDEKFVHGYVKYQEMPEFEGNIINKKVKTEDLPFNKRYAFWEEKEYRIIYKDSVKELMSKPVPIPISCIMKIFINPWMPQQVYLSVKSVIKKVLGDQEIAIRKSTIVNNKKWKEFGDKA